MEIKKIVRNKNLITRRIEGDFIILDVAKEKFYTLNSTALAIWKILIKPQTLDEITEAISIKFEIPQQKARKDVENFLNKFKGKLFLEKSDV